MCTRRRSRFASSARSTSPRTSSSSASPEQCASGCVARALQEDALTVDRYRGAVAAHLAERDGAGEPVARDPVDLDVELERAERLRPEGARPPAGRIVDGQRPRELVRAGRERGRAPRVEQHVARRAAHDGVHVRVARFRRGVERDVAREAAALDRRVDALHARRVTRTGPVDAMRTGRQMPPGFERAVEHGRLPVAAGDGALGGAVVLRRTRHFDREQVLGTIAQRLVTSNECRAK